MLVLLSLACVGLGGWALVAPALPKASGAVVEPPADLEALRIASSPDVASTALGRASDAPIQLASASLTTQARAASGSASSSSQCGQDQAPVYADYDPEEDGGVRGVPVQAKAAGVGYLGAQRRVDAALRATGDPFDAAVADALNVGELRTPDDRLAALVQDAVSADDPRLYALVSSICKSADFLSQGVPGGPPAAGEPGRRACARLDPRRWAARDPGNAVPWLYVLERADAAGDRAGQREALQQLGATSRFEMGFGAASAAVARVHPPDEADLAGQSSLVIQAVPFELWPSFTGVTLRCRDKAAGDAAMVATCEHVANVMYAHSDGLITRAVGGSIHKLATGDPTLLDRAHAEHKELANAWGARITAGAHAPACDHARGFLRHFVLVGKVGEVEAMKQEIAARATPY